MEHMKKTSQERDMATCCNIEDDSLWENKVYLQLAERQNKELYLPEPDKGMENPLEYNISDGPLEEVGNAKERESLEVKQTIMEMKISACEEMETKHIVIEIQAM